MTYFSFPFETEDQTIELRSPVVGSAYTQPSKVVIHTSMSNKIRTYKTQADEGETVTLHFRDSGIKLREALQFFREAQGHYLKYVDEDSEVWKCLIPVKEISIIFEGRGKTCNDNDYGSLNLTIRRWLP